MAWMRVELLRERRKEGKLMIDIIRESELGARRERQRIGGRGEAHGGVDLLRFSFGSVLMGLIIAAMLLLVGIAYSSADLLLPCLRDLWLLRRNNRLQMRNAWRRERARALQQGSPRVERKVARASRQARERRLEATDLA